MRNTEVKVPVSVWAMFFTSLVALWYSSDSLLTVVSTVAIFIVPTLYEGRNPTPEKQRNAGLAGVVACFVLPIAFKDRLAVLVAVALMHAFKFSLHRPLLASIAMIVIAGATRDYVLYGGFSALWFLFCCIFAFKSSKLPERSSIRTYLIPIGAIFISLATMITLPFVASGLISWSVGKGAITGAAFGAISDLNGISNVQTSSSLALRLFAKSPRLLRGQIYSLYQEGKWFAFGGKPFHYIGYLEDEELREKRDKGVETVELVSSERTGIWVPAFCELADVPAVRVERNALGAVYSSNGNVTGYSYFPLSVASKGRTLLTTRQAKGTALPSHFLGTLSGKKGRKLRKIAQKWTKDCKSDEEKLIEIERHLITEYTYSLSPGTPSDGRDPILYFLSESKMGHCELFASAFVLLARTCKIPARYTTGFSVSEDSAFGGYKTGRYSDAHAWAEAYIEKTGWHTVDPTPPDWKASNRFASVMVLRDLFDYGWYIFAGAINFLQNMYEDIQKQDEDEFTWLPYVLFIMLLITLRFLARYSKSDLLKKLTSFISGKFSRLKKTDRNSPTKWLDSLEKTIAVYGLKRSRWQSIGDLRRQIRSSKLSSKGIENCEKYLACYESNRYGGQITDSDEMMVILSTIRTEIEKSLSDQDLL